MTTPTTMTTGDGGDVDDGVTDVPDVNCSKIRSENETLVRDYLLCKLQLNLLHGEYRDKAPAEAVQELMEAKRAMQEKENEVVRKFAALSEQYSYINGELDPEKMEAIENHKRMIEEIQHWLHELKAVLEKANGNVEAFLADHRALQQRIEQLESQIKVQEEIVGSLNVQLADYDEVR